MQGPDSSPAKINKPEVEQQTLGSENLFGMTAGRSVPLGASNKPVDE